MRKNISLYVSFNESLLGEGRQFDRRARGELVERLTQLIRKKFPLLLYGPGNATACAVSIAGPPHQIGDLIDYFETHRELGTYTVDGDVIRTVRPVPLQSEEAPLLQSQEKNVEDSASKADG